MKIYFWKTSRICGKCGPQQHSHRPNNRRTHFDHGKYCKGELDLRAYSGVKLFLSGGIDERDIERYNIMAADQGICSKPVE